MKQGRPNYPAWNRSSARLVNHLGAILIKIRLWP